MNVEELRREIHELVDATGDEDRLERVAIQLRYAPPERKSSPDDRLVSFDADGTGYTAKQLGDTLDARVRDMRENGTGLSLEEFSKSLRLWRKDFE